MDTTFQGKVVWLVGASSGIGRAMALQFAAAGAKVVVSSRNVDALKELQKIHPDRIQVLALDLMQEAARQASLTSLRQLVPGLDIFVYCSGITQRSLAEETSLETVRAIMEVNFFGAVHLSNLLLQEGMMRAGGQLVLISSVVGYVGTPKRSTYAASKHALQGYFQALRGELHGRDLHVTVICPGYVATGIESRSLRGDGSTQNAADSNRPRGLSAEEFAIKALQAIASKKTTVLIGGGELSAVYLQRFLPGVADRIAHKFSPEAEDTIWPAHQFLEGSSYRMHYRLSPVELDKKIILIPGFSSPIAVFAELIARLEKQGYQVLTFDYPGRGLSTDSEYIRSLDAMADRLDMLLNAVGWLDKKWDILGFSWGTGLASAFALRHAPQVKRLLWVAPVGLADSSSAGMRLFQLPVVGKAIAKSLGPATLEKDFLKGFAHPDRHQAYISQWQQQSKRPSFQQTVLANMRDISFNFENLFQQIGSQSFPVGLIASRVDHKLHPKLVERLQTWIPRMHADLLTGGSHMLPLENPQEIIDFLGRVKE